MSENNQNKKTLIIFRKLNLPKVKKETVKKIEVKIPIKKKPTALEKKFEGIQTMPDNFQFGIQENSIKEYLVQCHPDVKKLVDENQITRIKTLTHGLEIDTTSKLRITINTISRTERSIVIYKKRELLFKGKSTVHFVKQN